MRDQRHAGVEALARREAAEPAGDVAGRDLADHCRRNGEREQPADVAERRDVDREPEDEEEQRGEDVAEAEEALLDLLPHRGLGEDDAGHQGADRLREAERVGDRRHPDQEAEDREQEELARQPVEEPVDRRREPLRERERDRDEADRLATIASVAASRAAAARGEAEDERDRDVLGDRIARTRSVSSSASRRKSIRPLTAIALDET